MLARVALLLTVLALAAPAGAIAQFEPLPPEQQAPPQQQPTVAPVNTSDADGGLDSSTTWIFVLLGIALIGGIGYLVVRDARRRAPVEEPTERGPKGTVSPQRHARARAKAKAGRASRKRNRAKR